MPITYKTKAAKTAADAVIQKAKENWLIYSPVVPADEALAWLEAQDPDCSRADWLNILIFSAKKGLTSAQVQAWSAQSPKFNQADFDNSWAGALVLLAKPHDPDAPAPSPPSPEQQAVAASLEQHFKAWPDAQPDHPYLTKKGIPPDGLKVVPSSSTMTVATTSVAGWLAVPCRTLEGVMTTVQYIGPDGQKLSAPGASFGSGMFIAGEVSLARPVYIGEGLASAWACVQAGDGAAVCTFGSSRTGTVAKALRESYGKNLKLVVVADRGKEAQAAKVAQEVDGYVVTMPADAPPNFDAWDYAAAHGAKALAALLNAPHASKQDAADPYARLDWTDTGSASILAKLADGDLRYVHERKRWIHWDGQRWSDDEEGLMLQAYALRVAAWHLDKAAQLRESMKDAPPDVRAKTEKVVAATESWAAHCRSKKALAAMVDLASHIPGIPISTKKLDANPRLLGVQNGVVDLTTGELRATARDDLVTRRSPLAFDAGAVCPKWELFIEEITGAPMPAQVDASGNVIVSTVGLFKPRPDLADYIHRFTGYCATGDISQHKLFVFVGSGSNGKSVLLDTIRWVLGNYATTCPPDLLLETKAGFSGGASPDIAALAGARMALASESKENQKFAPATIKRLTGGDSLNGRFLYANPVTFEPGHKLVLQTNSVPTLDHLDAAIKGRLHLVPFDRRWNRPGESDANPALPDGDEHLVDDLRAEGPGILAWIVRGAVSYQKVKLKPPTEVVSMTKSYFADQDVLGKWLAGYEKCDPKDGTPAKQLFEAFRTWCDSEGFNGTTYSKNSFSAALLARQVKKDSNNKGTWYGLTLKNDDLAALAGQL